MWIPGEDGLKATLSSSPPLSYGGNATLEAPITPLTNWRTSLSIFSGVLGIFQFFVFRTFTKKYCSPRVFLANSGLLTNPSIITMSVDSVTGTNF